MCVNVDRVYIYKGSVISPQSGKSYSQLVYTVNGFDISELMFDRYLSVDSVYILVGMVVSPEEGKRLELLGDDNLRIVQKEVDHTRVQSVFDEHLKVVKKDGKQTLIRTVQARKVTKQFIPIVAVIFDKGTQVVAATRVFSSWSLGKDVNSDDSSNKRP